MVGTSRQSKKPFPISGFLHSNFLLASCNCVVRDVWHLLPVWRPWGWFGTVLGLQLCVGCGLQDWREGEEARDLKAELHSLVRERVSVGKLARSDGFVYTVEISQLMLFAAREGDQDLYETLARFAMEKVVLNRPDDPYTRGFVLWRYREGSKPDASGTTEALRLAQGLWAGWKAFNRKEDREWALIILRGYVRHSTSDGSVWMIRNYFNLGTRAYSTNSFLVDYAPDFVSKVANESGDMELAEIARQSYLLIERAQAPTGLIYDILQPEIGTLMHDKSLIIFSPNDAIQTSNSVSIVTYSVQGSPHVARKLIKFCLDEMPRLRFSYYGRTGEVHLDKQPGIEAWALLVRVAVTLEDREALDIFYPYLASNAGRTEEIPDDAWLFVASELLLGLQAVTSLDTRVD